MQLLPTLVATALLVTAIPASLGEEIKIIPGEIYAGNSMFKSHYFGVAGQAPYLYPNHADTKEKYTWTKTPVPRNSAFVTLKHSGTGKCLEYGSGGSVTVANCVIGKEEQKWQFEKINANGHDGRWKIFPSKSTVDPKKTYDCLERSDSSLKVRKCNHTEERQYFIPNSL
ncbi:hypothetical protein BDF19DRAFT_453373 [Syncephalis fuscata]|nr:hypothetical protein BDF19DRAFT_458503 [Syncephalis fuscata]KAI9591886.1 hypothetical protein BDF19DRAFT_453373 [Syncephalis fuscata]